MLTEKSLFLATKPSSVPKGVAREKHPKTISGELSETPLRRERLDTCPRAEGAAKVGQHLRAMGQACHTGILLFFAQPFPSTEKHSSTDSRVWGGKGHAVLSL